MSRHDGLRLKKNNFDLLRLLFALTVCLFHACDLSGFPPLEPLSRILPRKAAIQGFFVISGFLIFMSFERSPSYTAYIRKRILRIYPAYFTIIMICAILLVAVSTKGIRDYFSWIWVKYVFVNLAFLNFLQPTLPGVFESYKMSSVNGALWTLKIEVMFYMSVPLWVYLFRKFSHLPILILVYCASVAYAGLFQAAAERTGLFMYEELGRQLPGQLSYFMAGGFIYYFLPKFERYAGYFLSAGVFVLAANMFYPMFYPPHILQPFALASVVVFLGLYWYVGNFGKYGDFSYGTYILHFPIIQLLLYAGWFRESPWLFLAAVIIITTIGAVAMWHFIEKQFLLRSSHYIKVS